MLYGNDISETKFNGAKYLTNLESLRNYVIKSYYPVLDLCLLLHTLIQIIIVMKWNVEESFWFVWHVWINQKCILWIDCFHTTKLFAQTWFHVGCRMTPFFLHCCSRQKWAPNSLIERWMDDGGLWARMINSCLFTCCLGPKCRHLVQPPVFDSVLARLGPPALSAG